MDIDLTRFVAKTVARRVMASFLVQPDPDGHCPLDFGMLDAIEVQSRSVTSLKFPENAVAVGFHDQIDLAFEIDGKSYELMSDDPHREWEDRINPSPWYFLGGEIVTFDAVPDDQRGSTKPDRRSVFVRTRLGTYCHMREEQPTEVL